MRLLVSPPDAWLGCTCRLDTINDCAKADWQRTSIFSFFVSWNGYVICIKRVRVGAREQGLLL